ASASGWCPLQLGPHTGSTPPPPRQGTPPRRRGPPPRREWPSDGSGSPARIIQAEAHLAHQSQLADGGTAHARLVSGDRHPWLPAGGSPDRLHVPLARQSPVQDLVIAHHPEVPTR